MMRRHRIDIICRCYSNIEICQFIAGDLQRDFQESRENLFIRKTFYDETGRVIEVIREIEIEDASSFLQLSKQLDEETKFMLYEPGERKTTAEQQEKMIHRFIENEYATIFVAVEDERIVGFILVNGNNIQRKRHVATIVIGILQEYNGRGIGTRLFKEVEKWAKLHDVWRLELTVMAHNTRAQALYKKAGFEKEGVKKAALIIDGKGIDEYEMAKLLK
ncbi:ribosomal-protein-alanine acetyltransferase [Bacillus cereus VD184]|jgi:RimJ/RimL family protein N-acetyltransferase|uniref:Ribosomal-protein-alanine acetyltransferase n=1 Tax=Bacillus cereus VD184 TaxID=1053242 RepID=A0A9W5R8A6_BACCE|nr:Ribosomal-protein-alanine acetyltransferase [Bacillus cereus]EOQ16192.1 ribosomal-protein-alanine acetyltransferase [Bacillus cereus VD184]